MNADILSIAGPYSALSAAGLEKIHGLASTVTVPGAVVECGVCYGGSAAVLWNAVGTERPLWLFDSWEGMPHPTEPDGGRAFNKYAHMMNSAGSWNKGDLVQVKKLIRKVGRIRNAHFIQGWVEDTLPHWSEKIGPIALLHLDMDFYQPTLWGLIYLYPLVSPGGIVLIDDYDAWQGCRQAVDEYMTAGGLSFAPDGCYLRVAEKVKA